MLCLYPPRRISSDPPSEGLRSSACRTTQTIPGALSDVSLADSMPASLVLVLDDDEESGWSETESQTLGALGSDTL